MVTSEQSGFVVLPPHLMFIQWRFPRAFSSPGWTIPACSAYPSMSDAVIISVAICWIHSSMSTFSLESQLHWLSADFWLSFSGLDYLNDHPSYLCSRATGVISLALSGQVLSLAEKVGKLNFLKTKQKQIFTATVLRASLLTLWVARGIPTCFLFIRWGYSWRRSFVKTR